MPSGKYKYERVTFRYNGRQYEATGKTKREAIAKAERKKLKLENALKTSGGNMPMKQWAAEWLENFKAPAVGEGQYLNYVSLINSIIVPAIGARKISDIKDIDLQKILNTQAGKSKSHVSKLRFTLKSMFKQARISRMIQYDPSENLIMPAAKDGTHRSITDEEREAILQLAETHYAGLWIEMILYCGLRPGETRALDWRHINFGKKRVYVAQAMKARTTRIDAPKSPSGVREIPLPDNLSNKLQERQGKPNEPVFKQPTTGKRHTKSSMQCYWGNFKRELDILMGARLYRNQIIESMVAPDLVPYCLRHTYGTDLQDMGVSINIAKYLMGHSDISMTANIYTHTTETAIEDAARKINGRKTPKMTTGDELET